MMEERSLLIQDPAQVAEWIDYFFENLQCKKTRFLNALACFKHKSGA